MSEIAVELTAIIRNQSPYTFTYQSQDVTGGTVTIDATTIGSSASPQAFTAQPGPGKAGCAGSVFYSFIDQQGGEQSLTFSYDDPYLGENSCSVVCPPGMTGTGSVPEKGFNITAVYTVSGTVQPG